MITLGLIAVAGLSSSSELSLVGIWAARRNILSFCCASLWVSAAMDLIRIARVRANEIGCHVAGPPSSRGVGMLAGAVGAVVGPANDMNGNTVGGRALAPAGACFNRR